MVLDSTDISAGAAGYLDSPAVRAGSKLVERAPDTSTALVEDVGIDHGRAHVAMSEQLLDRADVVLSVEQMCREAVPERMTGSWTRNASRPGRVLHRPLENGFVQVMTPRLSGSPIDVEPSGGKHPLPGPFLWGAGVLRSKGAR